MRLTVTGDRGVFTSAPGWYYTFSEVVPGKPLVLRCNPVKAQYLSLGALAEKFLVVPLSNFVTEFPSHWSDVRKHPLSLLTDESAGFRRRIPFLLGNEPAFIEPLPGYEEAGADLKSGSTQTALTSIAVVPIQDSSMADPWGWFLNSFLWLLDFATGSKVGSPWVELRDENGGLVRRLHFALGRHDHFYEGYGAVRLSDHWWNGEFLTAALATSEAKEPFFRIALRHCFSAGGPGQTLDDQMAHLIRALECLCSRYDLKVQDLSAGLDDARRGQIESALAGASKDIRNLLGAAANSSQSGQISRIAERVRSASRIDKPFGLAVESSRAASGWSMPRFFGPTTKRTRDLVVEAGSNAFHIIGDPYSTKALSTLTRPAHLSGKCWALSFTSTTYWFASCLRSLDTQEDTSRD
jgi:hypothetical protein